MKLCDKDIEKAIAKGRITIEPPLKKSKIHGLTVDLTLGKKFRTFKNCNAPYIDLSGPTNVVSSVIDKVMGPELIISGEESFFLHPGELVLGTTAEIITLANDLVGWLDGRSSLARLGLMVHATAHRIDPGWSGVIVLEFINSGKLPLALKPGMIICAMNFEPLSGPATRPYNNRDNAKYKEQDGPVASRINDEILLHDI